MLHAVVQTLQHCFYYTLEMLLLIKTYGAYHAAIGQVLLSIWYLKYQILSKQEVFEKYQINTDI